MSDFNEPAPDGAPTGADKDRALGLLAQLRVKQGLLCEAVQVTQRDDVATVPNLVPTPTGKRVQLTSPDGEAWPGYELRMPDGTIVHMPDDPDEYYCALGILGTNESVFGDVEYEVVWEIAPKLALTLLTPASDPQEATETTNPREILHAGMSGFFTADDGEPLWFVLEEDVKAARVMVVHAHQQD